ncbi:MAG: gliding motility-associated C-terminal domain-containing protein [Cytophagales bacterium]|nr:gliding motility-associated C-terminal domain-containing protein [Cytophagales bacterium]
MNFIKIRIKKRIASLLALLLCTAFVTELRATHIRAGEIIARRIDNLALTFEFTFIGYRDTESGIQFGNGIFDFGDGNFSEADFRITEIQIAPNIVRAEFRVIHTYQAPSAYTVSYQEDFRNAGIANMANSVNTAFYVETQIVIDPLIGINNTPVLTVPPIDDGLTGVRFVHNPGAFDEDGDSLVFRLVRPKQARDVIVTDYRFPADPSFYNEPAWAIASEGGDEATFTIDEITGTLTWDAPGDFLNLSGSDCPEGATNCAEYNIAFVVEEWRNILGTPVRLGFVTRDMQIIITDGDNERPELEVPDPICVEAGELVEETIFGTDPDGHQVRLEAFGGPFEVLSPASVIPDPPLFQTPPAELDFSWSTVCGHVRDAPYTVQFKVTDDPVNQFGEKVGPSLVEFGSWEITVVGPAPTGLGAVAGSGRSIQLDWDSYSCPNAQTIQVWRRVGDFGFVADDCLVGIPENSGYQLIEEIPAFNTSYLDDDRGRGLAPGAKYCYRLVAKFPLPEGGTSYASEEICLTLEADSPVMTNVDVNRTGEDGEIIVRWTPPYEINDGQFPPPYRYDLFRAPGLGLTGTPELIASNLTDTSFADSGINTLIRGYSYRVALFDGGGTFVDSSAIASSVRLELSPSVNSIEMDWSANVPWSNNIQDYPYHYIYRNNVLSDATEIVLIDSVRVAGGGFTYLDDGSFNGVALDEDTEYCYFVTTFGAYDNSPLIPEPLINRSQILCAQPSDIIPPCEPISVRLNDNVDCESRLLGASCTRNSFENNLAWEADPAEGCDDDIESYNIYFSPTGLEEDYAVVANVVDQFFTHDNLSSFKGCYRISALDRSGNESELTEEICVDNCPNFTLPNVFTPNNDGKNDLFTPFFSNPSSPISGFDNNDCPRFIEQVVFMVFDRNGKTIFDYDSSEDAETGILINWNGKSNDGSDLPAGVYFYSAEVQYDVLAASEDQITLNGWVQILR